MAGWQGFLRPPPISELLSATVDGPVVVYSICAIRSDALIVRTHGIEVVPLADATSEAVAARAREFLDAVADQGDLTGVLGWLWDMIVEPVLDTLPDDPAQRIWWCPTGSLSFLPRHAAGRDGINTMDRVVSSSAPTIRALPHAPRAETARDAQALVVAATQADGAPVLPGAEREVSRLARKLPRSTVLRDAGRDWAHFACHGITDTAHPSRSGLVLHDDLLIVVDIARLRLDTDLAMLSACSSAAIGPVLPDEAIHLASAFQLAVPARGGDVVAGARRGRPRFLPGDHGAWCGQCGVPGHPQVRGAYVHIGP